MKAGADSLTTPVEEQQEMPGAKVSRAEMIALLQFGVACALATVEGDQRGEADRRRWLRTRNLASLRRGAGQGHRRGAM